MLYYGLNDIPEDGVLVYEVDTDPLSLDPTCCSDYIGSIIIQALYEPLYVRHVETGEWQLEGAEYCEISEDGLTYTFDLKKDKKWSDGNPVVAEDFVFAWRRLADPATNSSLRVNISPILNADEIDEGSLSSDQLGVYALDERTLQLKLAYPIPYMEAMLGMCAASPLPSHYQLQPNLLFSVSNGPFYLTEYQTQQFVKLNVNNEYGVPSTGSVTGIRFQINGDLTTSLANYQENIVHITCNTYFPYEQIQKANEYADFYMEPSGILFFLQFNRRRHPIFKDRLLREMLYQMINKREVVQKLSGGLIAWEHFIPKTMWVWGTAIESTTMEDEQQDQKAGELSLPPLKILYSEFYPNREVLVEIQRVWEKVYGITIQLEGVGFEEFVQRTKEEDYDLCLQLVAPSYSEPLGCFLSYLHDLDEDYANLLIEQLERAINEPGQRDIGYQEADRLLREELPLLPLFNGYSLYFVKPTIQGYRLFPDGLVCFRSLVWIPLEENAERAY